MDHFDLDIISFLQSDGRISFTDIAKALKVSEGTVRNRVARLIEDRILQIVGMVDPYRLGFDAPAVISVSVQPPLLEKVVDSISKFTEVSYLIMISGEDSTTGSAVLDIATAAPPGPGDDCSTATPLASGPQIVPLDNTAATPSGVLPGCGGGKGFNKISGE